MPALLQQVYIYMYIYINGSPGRGGVALEEEVRACLLFFNRWRERARESERARERERQQVTSLRDRRVGLPVSVSSLFFVNRWRPLLTLNPKPQLD